MLKQTAWGASALAIALTAGVLTTALNRPAEAQIGNPPVNLYTPPLRIEERDLFAGPVVVVQFRCQMVNITGQNRTVRIRIKNQSGTVVEDTGNLTLGAGDILQLLTEVPDNGTPGHISPPFYCQFTTSGAKSDVRAVATVGGGLEGNLSDFVAVPAQ
jgi:hypothetical protein